MDEPIIAPPASWTLLRAAVARSGNTELAAARAAGVPALVFSKRLRGITADGTGQLSPVDEARCATLFGSGE